MKRLRLLSWLVGTCALAGGATRQWMKTQAARIAEKTHHNKDLSRFEGEGGLVLD